MKKFILFAMAAFMLLLFAPAQVNAATDEGPSSDNVTVSPEVEVLIARLEEINAMDMTMLARSEKRELRREVRDINKELKDLTGGGLYISVGAAILIVLLLILLL